MGPQRTLPYVRQIAWRGGLPAFAMTAGVGDDCR